MSKFDKDVQKLMEHSKKYDYLIKNVEEEIKKLVDTINELEKSEHNKDVIIRSFSSTVCNKLMIMMFIGLEKEYRKEITSMLYESSCEMADIKYNEMKKAKESN